MYGIFTYIWAIFGEHVGKYSICGAYGSGVLASDVYRTPGLKNHAAWLMSMRLSSKRNMPKKLPLKITKQMTCLEMVGTLW